MLKNIIFTGMLLVAIGCAGPTNPFGSTAGWSMKKVNNPHTYPVGFGADVLKAGADVQISFYPKRILFHDGSDFKIHVDDPSGIRPGYKIRVMFNHEDTTELFLERATTTISKKGTRLTFHVPGIRFTSQKKNELWIYYQRDEFSPFVGTIYEPPHCDFEDQWKLGQIKDFDTDGETLELVNRLSSVEGINPSFMAGLIAQESGFDPKAVSRARALGLTQVTSSAEAHILENYPDWPVYEPIKDISLTNLKFYINAGFINEKNEWRLDRERSILGGIQYLKYLDNYWNLDEQKFILDTIDNRNKTDILLASYNSGAYRVKKAMKQLGGHWMRSHELVEARKYLNHVKSYCYHFYHDDHGGRR